jgi:hypothetical protein
MNKKTAVMMLGCIMIYLVGTFSAFGQEKEIDLKDKRITIKMEKQPLGLVFRYLMENYEIPIGFEESILDRNHIEYAFDTNLPAVATHKQQKAGGSIKLTTTSETAFKANLHPITLNFENGKLKDVFNQIVKQMENYKWEINNGVVNIFPIKGRDERFEKLLGLHIERFAFEKGKTVEDITNNIMLLPEFRSFIKDSNLYFYGIRTGVNFVIKAQYGRTIDEGMDFSNLTFRELLNKATKIKKGGWILKWRYVLKTTGKELINIDI